MLGKEASPFNSSANRIVVLFLSKKTSKLLSTPCLMARLETQFAGAIIIICFKYKSQSLEVFQIYHQTETSRKKKQSWEVKVSIPVKSDLGLKEGCLFSLTNRERIPYNF